jgi:hypothetical protein
MFRRRSQSSLLVVLSAVTCASLASCAQVFGIDETSGPPVEEGRDVSFSWTQGYIGATYKESPLDLTGATGAFFTTAADGTRTEIPSTVGAPGTFVATVNDTDTMTHARVVLPTLNNGAARFYKLPGNALKGITHLARHEDQQPPPMGATITFQGIIDIFDPALDVVHVIVMGPWSRLIATAGQTMVNYSSFIPMYGGPLVRITPEDKMVLIRQRAGFAEGSLIVDGFTQAANNLVVGNLNSFVRDKPVAFNWNAPATVAAFAGTQPSTPLGGAAWYVNYTPLDAGHDVGVGLAAIGLDIGAAESVAVAANYGIPFTAPGWDAVFTLHRVGARSVTIPNFGQFSVNSSTLYLAPPAGSASATADALLLPQSVSVAGTVTSTDGMSMTIDRARPVRLSIAMAPGATCQMSYFVVFEYQKNMAMEISGVMRAEAFSIDREIEIDNSLFEAGKHYSVVGTCFRQGFTNVANGDLSRSYPHEYGQLAGGTFTVMN